MMEKIKDAKIDLSVLTKSQKILLYPVMVKIFGLLKATVILFGK